MNKTLEATGQAIFKRWFIDFEFPNEEGKPYEASGGRMVYSQEWQQEVPLGWRTSTIGNQVEVGGGTTPSTTEESYWGGDINWATPKDMSSLESPILTDTERKITRLGLNAIGSRTYPKGTLLMSSRAPIGYLAITDVDTAVNQGVIAMVCHQTVSSFFMINWCSYHLEQIENRANGTTFREISKSNFRSMPILIPPESPLSAYRSFVESLYSKIGANQKESSTLANLRDSLLPKLMSGKLKVPSEVR
jgi:type I restriction enzyme S subunit